MRTEPTNITFSWLYWYIIFTCIKIEIDLYTFEIWKFLELLLFLFYLPHQKAEFRLTLEMMRAQPSVREFFGFLVTFGVRGLRVKLFWNWNGSVVNIILFYDRINSYFSRRCQIDRYGGDVMLWNDWKSRFWDKEILSDARTKWSNRMGFKRFTFNQIQ